jgi:hypothetical protein
MVNNSGNLSFGANATLKVGYAGAVLLTNTADQTLIEVNGGTIGTLPNWTIQLPFGWSSQGIAVVGNLVVLKQLSVASSTVGDYNYNGVVDAADYVVWRNLAPGSTADLAADGNRNGQIDSGDYDVWRAHFGQTWLSGSGAFVPVSVPEPSSFAMLLVLGATLLTARQSNSARPGRSCPA